jgi:hypothetical protein
MRRARRLIRTRQALSRSLDQSDSCPNDPASRFDEF